MLIGMRTIRKIKELEELAHTLGFKFANGDCYYNSPETDSLSLMPRDEELPHYSRDAKLWYGDVDSLDHFLRGFQFANQYYKMLKLISDEKVTKKEQDERNRQLMNLIKSSANDQI